MSIAGKKKSTLGPGHDGAPKRGFFSTKGKLSAALRGGGKAFDCGD